MSKTETKRRDEFDLESKELNRASHVLRLIIKYVHAIFFFASREPLREHCQNFKLSTCLFCVKRFHSRIPRGNIFYLKRNVLVFLKM